jgi:dTDP-L-rhamnose 4-epimerase
MRVLVTGAAGFIGSHVAEALSAAGHDVVGLDRRPMSTVDGLVGDVRDRDAVARAVRGVQAVVHQAAMVGMGVDLSDLPAYVGCNDLGTAVLLAEMAAAGVTRLVLASSMVVYGEGAYACPAHGAVRPAPRSADALRAGRFEPPCPGCGAPLMPGTVEEHAPLEPRSVYAATKLTQEHLARVWANACGAGVVALRYHNVYGPRMPRDTPYSGVAATFRSALQAGQPPRVFEDGGQRRDFVHVRDVARANTAAVHATARPGLRAYNVASGRATTVLEMATALAAAMAGPSPVVTGEFRAGDVRHVVASPALARAELGFAAEVPFEVGIAEFARAPVDCGGTGGSVPAARVQG